ncbi:MULTISPECIES: hypothetical protein [Bacteria]|uniref:Uncharacterized protein n=1 Tax=Lactobacillus johnsonii TaxID=33959 RepID=A0A9X6NZP0_LACJH|nr:MULTISPECIES: hypothetical protein [Bacteria]OYS05052.1 hypothetical protein CBF54_03325 [Lactobacillus johnsonii]OYS07239.1 hypothetical protein CBF62_05870 [Lactobacillus johnsonii]OYS07999.1 hypothetical protein CBF63_06165 [Lactobacillus johnsonii]OYS09759.1 hypothetical protein CBF65_03130 [Lactobacillus johnsonii]OYS12434.1 hypothetical protein CBF50_06130 [Lactobacillus johnsonii]
MDLSNFKPFTMVAGRSFVTISKNGVAFSQAAVAELEKSEYVIVLFNSQEKQMAIKQARQDDDNAIAFYKKNRKNLNVRWNNSMLKEKIGSMMDWNLHNDTYRVEGKYDRENQALIFDLLSAEKS